MILREKIIYYRVMLSRASFDKSQLNNLGIKVQFPKKRMGGLTEFNYCWLQSVLLLLGFSILSPVHSFAASISDESNINRQKISDYTIQPEDILNITVIGEPDLTRNVTVLPDGKISYPYVGEFNVLGLTAKKVQSIIREKVALQVVNPEVSVSITKHVDLVKDYDYVSVLGAVKSPGKFIIQKDWNLLNVLAESGGLTSNRPEWTTALLVRRNETISIDILKLFTLADPKINMSVLPGDLLIVQDIDQAKTQVQVLGEVVRPGAITAPTDGSLAAVLASVGGPTALAALSRSVIRRNGENIAVNLQALMIEGKLPSDLLVKPGDILIIPTNKKQFSVFGAATKPGTTTYPDDIDLNVLTALSLSGGQAANADLKHVMLIRPSTIDKKPEIIEVNLWEVINKGNLSINVSVKPGDVIFVPDKGSDRRVQLGNVLNVIPSILFFLR